VEIEELIDLGHELRYALSVILREDLHCVGNVSLACCVDIAQHHDRDIERLYAVHQRLVHPSKHIAYAAFWIRKLKPVDTSYPIAEYERASHESTQLDESMEVKDINERICLHYAFRLMLCFVEGGSIAPPKGQSKKSFLKNLNWAFENFLEGKDSGPVLSDRFESVVYDMRYRTFGPHHVVHFVNALLSEASHGGN
jgi:hypothetical protein